MQEPCVFPPEVRPLAQVFSAAMRAVDRPVVLTLALALAGCAAAAHDTAAPATVTASAVDPRAARDEGPPISDDPVLVRVVELGRTRSQVDAHVRALTEDIGPRLTSSHNLIHAERWAVEQFERWGLTAWLDPWGEMAVGFDRGPWSGGQVAPQEIAYEFITPAWSPGVLGPHRGPAVIYPQSAREAADKARFSGAWVVKPRWERGAGPDRKVQEAIEAALAAAGAAGLIEADRDERGELVHTRGSHQIEWSALPSLVEIRLRADQHRDLVAQIEADQPVELAFSVDNRFFKGPVILNNVVAEIRGTEHPDEFVVVGGHLDSWDGSQGAVDNATGVATTMEAARLLAEAGARPKRTIRFMLWSGEEQGLLGSKGYVAKHPEEMDKISAVLVHDGGTNYLSGLSVTPEMMADMKRVFEPVTRLDPSMPFALVPTDGLRGGGSDHSSFISAGVPGFFWMQDGRSNYRCHHHTQFDTIDAVIPEYQRHSAMVVAIAAYNLANLDTLLDRRNMKPVEDRGSGVELDGLKIRSIEPGSAAARAGIRVGDEILAVDGEPVAHRYALYRAVTRGPAKKTVRVKRRSRTVDVTVDYSDPVAEAEKERRHQERIATYGPDALTVPKEIEERRKTAFGDDEKSCKP
jgi:carboxypeptidase Q